jgi:succinate dehydrogenase / fumarate reductase iron-sulfur subunit
MDKIFPMSPPIKKITFHILRFKPGKIEPPEFQNFSIRADPGMTVLDGLEKIRLEQDSTLMYCHSCHHSSCGTCACRINGQEKLACFTKIHELGGDIVELEPLTGFSPMGDLVVDMKSFYKDLSKHWSYLRKAEGRQHVQIPNGIPQFTRFENCIECGACISACPIARKNQTFLGPAVLAAMNNELKKSPEKTEELLSLAGNKRGVQLCERALNCSRVCPTGVYPARHIADMRGVLKKSKKTENPG